MYHAIFAEHTYSSPLPSLYVLGEYIVETVLLVCEN